MVSMKKHFFLFLVSLDIQEVQSWSSPTVKLRNAPIVQHVVSSDMLGSSSTVPYMNPAILPPKRNRDANSTHRLSRLDIQKAINDVKRFVEKRLEEDLHLTKVIMKTCPSCIARL